MREYIEKLTEFASGLKSHKTVLAVAAGIALVALYSFLAPSAEEVSESRLGGISLPDNTIQGSSPVTEEYKNALREADSQRIDEARRQGSSALPTIVNSSDNRHGLPKVIELLEGEGVAADEEFHAAGKFPDAKPSIAKTESERTSHEPAVDPEDVRQLANYMQSLSLTGPSPVSATIFMHPGVEEELMEAAANLPEPDGQSLVNTGINDGAASTLPSTGTVLFGHLIGRVSSDSPGPVLAEILHGRFAGTRLLGRFETAGNSTRIQFSQMTSGLDSNEPTAGRTVSINAVAVDTVHIGTALPTDVDRHLAQNLAASFVSGFARGLGRTLNLIGGTTTVSSDGSATTTTERLNLRNSLISATGQAVASTGTFLSDAYGNRPPTFVVAAGTPIGILFL